MLYDVIDFDGNNKTVDTNDISIMLSCIIKGVWKVLVTTDVDYYSFNIETYKTVEFKHELITNEYIWEIMRVINYLKERDKINKSKENV